MRKPLLILSLLFLSISLFSQQDVLLKRFKYRVNNYKEIYFNVNGGGQAYKTEFVSGDQQSSSSSGNVGGNYHQVKSTDHILLTLSGGISTGFNRSASEVPNNESKSRSFSLSSGISALNKWFTNKTFVEVGADLLGNRMTNKYIPPNVGATEEFKQGDYMAAITLGVGKGRLENVSDMQTALWLYQSLGEENQLSRSLTNEELDELGHTITLAKNTRVLDLRKRTRFMLEATDKFFQQKKVLTTNDIRYFSNLNDILFFISNGQRLSGTEFFLRGKPAISHAATDEINKGSFTTVETRVREKSASLSAGINKYIPANLKHQNNYGIWLQLKYISYHDDSKFFFMGNPTNQFAINTTIRQAGGHFFYQHAIYPNTRTTVSFDLNSDAGYQNVNGNSGFFGVANASTNLYYFISYRTSLTCNLGAAYQREAYGHTYYQRLLLLPNTIELYANAGLQVNL